MRTFLVLIAVAGLGFFLLTLPRKSLPFEIPEGDALNGEYIAIAAGCASCHGKDYAGGEPLYSPFGIFHAPNITPSNYQASKEEFARALLNGVSKNGKHLYPAFPYSSYQQMSANDVGDLYTYIASLPPVAKDTPKDQLVFFARWRRPLGLWKKFRGSPPEPEGRGGYLVEVLGHCQECHTPRSFLGTLRYAKSFEGGKIYNASRKPVGKAPSLVSGDSAHWSESEISSYLQDGFTPDFDSAGGAMVEVIENTSRLNEGDREDIAAYIDALSE